MKESNEDKNQWKVALKVLIYQDKLSPRSYFTGYLAGLQDCNKISYAEKVALLMRYDNERKQDTCNVQFNQSNNDFDALPYFAACQECGCERILHYEPIGKLWICDICQNDNV